MDGSEDPISTMLLIILSIVLATILIIIFVLICFIVAILKCPRNKNKSHGTVTRDHDIEEGAPDENIQTMVNICYEGLLEHPQTLESARGEQLDTESLHVYDDIATFKPPKEEDYENVDPCTGLPVIPKPHNTEQDQASSCDRACLPLRSSTRSSLCRHAPSLSTTLQQQQKCNPESRSRTLQQIRSDLHKSRPNLVKKGAVSVLARAADYEVAITKCKTMPH